METDAKTHSQTLDGARESYGRVEGRLEGPEEDRASTGTPTESTNLDLGRFPETESPAEEQAMVWT